MALKIINSCIWEELNTGKYDVIAQGCNCFSTQKAGIAVEFVKRFGTDKFPMEVNNIDPIIKLGNIDFQTVTIGVGETLEDVIDQDIIVVNCYTQYKFGKDGKIEDWKPASISALKLCLEKIRFYFYDKQILLPLIGGGLGGINPDIVIMTMEEVFCDVDVTLVLWRGKK